MPSIGDQLVLRRGDLTNFPKETVDLILEMQKEGWRGHRNNQGHVKMLAPDGETYVMATQNPNSPTYLRSGYNQYNKKHGKEEVNIPSPKLAQKWPCARPTCPKVYLSEEQLNTHIAVDHEKMLLCEYGGCFEVRASNQKLSIHMTHAHGYVSPRKAQRKKQEASRAEKEEVKKLSSAIINHDVEAIKEAVIAKEEIFDGESRNGRLDFFENTSDTSYSSKSYHEFVDDSEVVRTDDVSFIDDRDSWVMDISDISDRRVGTLKQVLEAAGLNLEVRVWKDK